MDMQTTIFDKHISEDLELQLAETISKLKFQNRKLVDIEETRDGKIAKVQDDTEGMAACMQEPEMDKGIGSHADDPMTTHDKALISSQQYDASPHKIGRILSFNCTRFDNNKDKDAPPAQIQSTDVGSKEKNLAVLSFEAPSFSLGISDTSSQETNSQAQKDISKKPHHRIFRRTLQLPPPALQVMVQRKVPKSKSMTSQLTK
jgi:hypothetical protein